MKTNLKKHEAKVKKIQQKLEKLQSEYPNLNFFDGNLLRVIDEHRKYAKLLIYSQVDVQGCKEQRFKCSDCICRG